MRAAATNPMVPHAGSLLSVGDISLDRIGSLLALTNELQHEPHAQRILRLSGRTVALLFYESSTRTRTSFELAAKFLGATTTLVSDKSSSIEKGESLHDTGVTLRALGAECIILRSNYSGAPELLARSTGLPVLNAGDGMHEHPSQALLDLRTMLVRLGLSLALTSSTLSGVTVVITGDVRHSRVARSNAMLLPRLGARVILCGPPELCPAEALTIAPGVEIERDFERALRQANVAMMLRIQRERLAGLDIDTAAYIANYQLNEERLARCAPSALVMHPGPMVRGLEMDSEVADGAQSAIEDQVAHGLAIRMALLHRALHPMGRNEVHAMSSLMLKNGRVIDPASGLDSTCDVLLVEGLIREVNGSVEAGAHEVLDCTGLVIAPGLIDMHVHLREPGQTHKETIATGTRAAVAGGVTTVVAMPNTVPVTDSVEWLRFVQSADRNPAARVLAMPAATLGSMGKELTDYTALAAAGAIGFTDDGKPVLDDEVMRQALIAAARLGLPLSQHAEDTRMTVGASMNFGPVAFRLGLRGMPVEAESSIVERDIRLLEEIERTETLRPHLHVQHVSTARALEAIRAAKARGLHVTCEVSPHHLAFTDEAIAGDTKQGSHPYDTHFKMNPPLRSSSDRDACITAVLDGTVDVIATDHAPHAAHEKNVEFERAPNGITGLETALGASLRILHGQHGMSLSAVLALFTSAPAEKFRLRELGHNVGRIAPGALADLVVFDAGAEWAYDVSTTASKSRNTPFHGAAMLGRVHATIVGGDVKFHAS